MLVVPTWAAIVALVMILYVVLDGTSLGIALLMPASAGEKERTNLMNVIAPTWDANQTWLVFGGAAIFAAFPVIYTVLSSALYLPLFTFIMGLIFRGVTFELRAHAKVKRPWDMAFFFGSFVAVMCQGLMLGGILTGVKMSAGRFTGGPFDWLTLFSVMVSVALISGYVMLGSTYVVMKTTGPLQDKMYIHARWSGFAVLGFMVVVTLWTPFHYPLVWKTWFSVPRIYFVWIFPLFGLVSAYGLMKSIKQRRELRPFFSAVGLYLSGYLGLVTSLYPYAIPPSVTFWEAAAQHETLKFILWGAAIVLPVVIAYVVYTYAVFRGKVSEKEYYRSA
jgi:cytochrome bd ubiquinol oxidase subunit II